MTKLTLEIEQGQAAELMKAIALRIEHAKSYLVDDSLKRVARQIEEQLTKIDEKAGKNLLEKIRYNIKRVSVTFYEENPKPRPEGL